MLTQVCQSIHSPGCLQFLLIVIFIKREGGEVTLHDRELFVSGRPATNNIIWRDWPDMQSNTCWNVSHSHTLLSSKLLNVSWSLPQYLALTFSLNYFIPIFVPISSYFAPGFTITMGYNSIFYCKRTQQNIYESEQALGKHELWTDCFRFGLKWKRVIQWMQHWCNNT